MLGIILKIKTYLINLDESNSRLSKATAQLNAAGWDFERYSACDGRGKSLSEFENYNNQAALNILGRSLLSSELGCYLSHYGCVEKFLHTDADYLVVLEDDLKITKDFLPTLNKFFEYVDGNLNLDWYVLNLASKKKKITKKIADLGVFSLENAYYFPIRGLGLVWNRKGAQEFLEISREIQVPVDIFLQNWLSRNARGLLVWPPLVEPAGIDSDILGTVAVQGIKRKDKEKRNRSFFIKKQVRIFKNNFFALKNFIFKT